MKLDRENRSSYELLVEATGFGRSSRRSQLLHSQSYQRLLNLVHSGDGRSQTTTTRVVISVLDVNDNAPVFTVPSASPFSGDPDYLGYHVRIPGDMPAGSHLVTLTATDADEGRNGLIAYSLFGHPYADRCFVVNQFSGVVLLAPSCNLSELIAKQSPVQLTAWAVDHGTPQLYANVSFVVRVIPVRLNRFPPQFNPPLALFIGHIQENMMAGTVVLKGEPFDGTNLGLQLQASDPEGSLVSFVISGGSGIGYFYIDNSGESG